MLNPKNIGSVTFLLIRKNQLPPTSVASRPREFSMNQFPKRFLFKLDSPRLVSRPFFPPPPLSIHGQTGKFSLKYSSGSTRSCRGFFVLDIIKPASFLLSSPSCPSREDVDNASTSQIDAKSRNCWTLDRTELNDEREREREKFCVVFYSILRPCSVSIQRVLCSWTTFYYRSHYQPFNGSFERNIQTVYRCFSCDDLELNENFREIIEVSMIGGGGIWILMKY